MIVVDAIVVVDGLAAAVVLVVGDGGRGHQDQIGRRRVRGGHRRVSRYLDLGVRAGNLEQKRNEIL